MCKSKPRAEGGRSCGRCPEVLEELRRVKPTTGETREGGIRGPGANRRPFERAGPHTVRPFVRGHSSSRSREISLSRARTLLAASSASTRRYCPFVIDLLGSIVIRDPADRKILRGRGKRASDLGGSSTWISIAITELCFEVVDAQKNVTLNHSLCNLRCDLNVYTTTTSSYFFLHV